MLIQDVWVLTMKKDGKYLICNMKWLAEHRTFGVVAYEEVATSLKNIDYEIKWSDGNMKWVDSIEGLTVVNFTGITYGKNNWFTSKDAVNTSTELLALVNTHSGIMINRRAIYEHHRSIAVTDREDEVKKLNNRLKLIGSEDEYFTNGIDLMLLSRKECKKVDPYIEYFASAERKKFKISDDIDVTNWDFLSLTGPYDYEDLRITAKEAKKLRYLELDSVGYTFNEDWCSPHKVSIDDNIDIESAVDVQLIPSNVKRFKRLYNCEAGIHNKLSKKEVRLDLSGIDYIGFKGLVAGYYMERVTLDFKDKYVVLCKDAIYITEHGKKHNQKVTIRYSNPEMHEQMEVYRRDDNFTVEYYGE